VQYLSASAVVIHYEEALYQVYAPLPLVHCSSSSRHNSGRLRNALYGVPFYLQINHTVDVVGAHTSCHAARRLGSSAVEEVQRVGPRRWIVETDVCTAAGHRQYDKCAQYPQPRHVYCYSWAGRRV